MGQHYRTFIIWICLLLFTINKYGKSDMSVGDIERSKLNTKRIKHYHKVIVGDEYCECRSSHCGTLFNPEGIIARAYFSEKYMPNFEFRTHSDSKAHSHATLAYLPLGPRLDFGLVGGERTQSKKWLFNLIISPTSESRKNLVKMVNSSSFAKQFNSRFILNVADKWHGDFGANAANLVNSTAYKNVLLRSTFTLCPVGQNPESFRIFEAIEAGSIPVLCMDSEYWEHPCRHAYLPFVKYNAPFVFLQHWHELPQTLGDLESNPSKVATMQRALHPWYQRFMANVSRQFESTLQSHINMSKVSPPTTGSDGSLEPSNLAREVQEVTSLLSFQSDDDFLLRKKAFNKDLRLLMVAALEGTGHADSVSMLRDCGRPPYTNLSQGQTQCLAAGTISRSVHQCRKTCEGLLSPHSTKFATNHLARIKHSMEMLTSKNQSSTRALYVLGSNLVPGSGQLSYPNYGSDRADRSLNHPDVYMLAKMAEGAGLDFRILVVLRKAEELLVQTARKGYGGRREPMVLLDNAAALLAQLSLLDRRFFTCVEHSSLRTMGLRERADLKRFLHPDIDLDSLVLQPRPTPIPKDLDLRTVMAANVAHYHVLQLESRLNLIRQLCAEPPQ